MRLSVRRELRTGRGEQVGYEAAKLLDRLMRGAKAPQKPTLVKPMGIVARKSTDTVAIADPLLSRAIRLIRERASSGLRVSDVLEEVPLSRSTLERSCRAALGRSPNAEINRVRLEEARRLLDDTDLTLQHIANRTGFGNVHYFANCFRSTFGQSPGSYRKRSR